MVLMKDLQANLGPRQLPAISSQFEPFLSPSWNEEQKQTRELGGSALGDVRYAMKCR